MMKRTKSRLVWALCLLLLACLALGPAAGLPAARAAGANTVIAQTDDNAILLDTYNMNLVGVRNAAPDQKETDYATSMYLSGSLKLLYYGVTYDGTAPEAPADRVVDFTQFDTETTATYLRFYLWVDAEGKAAGESLAGAFNLKVGLTNYLESGFGGDVGDYRFWRTTEVNTGDYALKDGTWQKILVRADSLQAPAFGDASANKTALATASTFGLRVGEYDGALKMLVHDARAVSMPKETAGIVVESLNQATYDTAKPTADLSAIEGQTFSLGEQANFKPVVSAGATVSAVVKNSAGAIVATIPADQIEAYTLDADLPAGSHVIEYTVRSAFGETEVFAADVMLMGAELVAGISFSALPRDVLTNEAVRLEPEFTYPLGTAADYAVSYSLTGPEGFSPIVDEAVESPEEWIKTFSVVGDYTLTVKVAYRDDSVKTAEENFAFAVRAGAGSAVTVTDIKDSNRSIQSVRDYSPAGAEISSYYMTSVPAAGQVLNLEFLLEGVDVSGFARKYAALTFWVCMDGAEFTKAAPAGMVLRNQNGAVGCELGVFHELAGFAYGKWNKVSLPFEKLYATAGIDAANLDEIQIYYHIGSAGPFQLLFSDFRLEERMAHGVLETRDADLTGPAATLPAAQDGMLEDAFDLALGGTDEPYTAAALLVKKNGQVVDTVEFTADDMQEKLGAFSFADYGAGVYQIAYRLTDAYANVSVSADVTITVYGAPDVDLTPVLDTFVAGDTAALAPIVTYTSGTAADYTVSFVLTGPEGFERLAVTVAEAADWNRVLTLTGSYTLTVTVTHTAGDIAPVVASTTFSVVAGPDESKAVHAQNIAVTDEVKAYVGTRTISPEHGGGVSYTIGSFVNSTPGQEGILNVMFRFDGVDVTAFNERYPALTFWVYVQNATLSTNSAGIVLLDANGAKFENKIYFHNLEGFAYGKWNLVSVDLKPLLTAPGFNEKKVSAIQFYYHMSIEDDFVLFLNDFAFTESRAYGVLEQEEIGEFSLVPPTITANLTGGAYSESFDLTPTLDPAGEATIVADIYNGDKLIETVTDAAKLASYTFLTGGAYTVKYTVTDAFGNVGRAEAQVVVTGVNPAAKPVITVPDSIQKSVFKDYQVNLSAVSAVDYAGNALQVSLVVTAPDGSAVTLSAGKFMAAQVGEYTVKATASDGTLSSETTFTITVTEDDSQRGNEGGGGCGGSAAGALGGLGGLLLTAAAVVLFGRRGKTV